MRRRRRKKTLSRLSRLSQCNLGVCESLFPREVANYASRQTCYSPSDPLCKECEKSRAVRMDDPTLLFQLICQLKIISCI